MLHLLLSLSVLLQHLNCLQGSTAGRMFVGQRQKSFSVNLGEVFDLFNFTPLDKASTPNGGIRNKPRHNVLCVRLNN